MTEFLPATRRLACVWHAYGSRMAAAGACLAFFATCASVSGVHAQSDPAIWQAFENRCLTPMENTEATDLTGLVAEEPEPGYAVFTGREGWQLRVATGMQAAQTCVVSGFEPDIETREAVLKWIGAALGADRYEVLPKLSLQSPTILRSTTWREPKIEMTFQTFDLDWGAYLMMRETDLES